MPDTSAERPTPPAASAVGGVLLGLGVGALGTATHLNAAPLAGAWTLPWGAALALLLAGSAQWWWMRRTADAGGQALPAGVAVAVGAFTAALALCRLPATDRLGLPWTPDVFAAMPGAALASVAWIAGLPVLGVVLPALAARGGRRGPRRTERVPWAEAPNPHHRREVDGQS